MSLAWRQVGEGHPPLLHVRSPASVQLPPRGGQSRCAAPRNVRRTGAAAHRTPAQELLGSTTSNAPTMATMMTAVQRAHDSCTRRHAQARGTPPRLLCEATRQRTSACTAGDISTHAKVLRRMHGDFHPSATMAQPELHLDNQVWATTAMSGARRNALDACARASEAIQATIAPQRGPRRRTSSALDSGSRTAIGVCLIRTTARVEQGGLGPAAQRGAQARPHEAASSVRRRCGARHCQTPTTRWEVVGEWAAPATSISEAAGASHCSARGAPPVAAVGLVRGSGRERSRVCGSRGFGKPCVA